MAQEYSNPKREHDPHALPDIEVWRAYYYDCPECGDMMRDARQTGYAACPACTRISHHEASPDGWFWWSCLPGCVPDSDPMGPFDSYAEALADAREGMDDDDGDGDDESGPWFSGRQMIRTLPAECIAECSAPGPCDEAVAYWLRRLEFDADPDLTRDYLRGFGAWDYLRGFGAWDADELANHEENRARLLWCVCGALREDPDYPIYLES